MIPPRPPASSSRGISRRRTWPGVSDPPSVPASRKSRWRADPCKEEEEEEKEKTLTLPSAASGRGEEGREREEGGARTGPFSRLREKAGMRVFLYDKAPDGRAAGAIRIIDFVRKFTFCSP